MGQVELLEAGQMLEVRTSEILIRIRETDATQLVVEAMPAVAGVELVTGDEQQGEIHRTTITSRDSGVRP